MVKKNVVKPVSDVGELDGGVGDIVVKKPVQYPVVIIVCALCIILAAVAVLVTHSTVAGMKAQAAAAFSAAPAVGQVAEETVDLSQVTINDDGTIETPAGDIVDPEVKTDGSNVYVIKAGDTLSEISAKTGVSVHHLALANKIEDVHVIYANSSLVIPEVVKSVNAAD